MEDRIKDLAGDFLDQLEDVFLDLDDPTDNLWDLVDDPSEEVTPEALRRWKDYISSYNEVKNQLRQLLRKWKRWK